MSLIHDALKAVDADAPTVVLQRAAPPAAAKPAQGWLGGVLAFAVVAGAGAGAYWLWQQSQHAASTVATPAVVPAPTAASGANPVLPTAPAPVPVAEAGPPVVLSVSGSDAPGAATPLNQSPALVVHEHPTPTPTPIPIPTSAAAPGSSAVVQAQGRLTRPVKKAVPKPVVPPPAAEPVDDTPVELRFARFVAAMHANDSAAAEVELGLLRKRLPEGALGLIRAQAWYDLKGGREDAALVGYQTILDRLPGDEEATINIASVYSQRQQGEKARAVLASGVRVNPDSLALRSALNQFGQAGRP